VLDLNEKVENFAKSFALWRQVEDTKEKQGKKKAKPFSPHCAPKFTRISNLDAPKKGGLTSTIRLKAQQGSPQLGEDFDTFGGGGFWYINKKLVKQMAVIT